MHSLRTITYVILAFVVSALFAAAIPSCVHAHEAPSGFQYPSDCCAGQDCHPVGCTTITTRADGGASWTGLAFTREQVKYSGDAECHVCVGYSVYNGNPMPTRYPHCLFLSPTN